MLRKQYILRTVFLALILVMTASKGVCAGATSGSGAAAAWASRAGHRDGDNVVPLGIRYTKKHPLIIVSDWMFQPYSFMNDEGKPDGFHIQLTKEIFKMIRVPYEIHMKEWKEGRREVVNRSAHLAIGVTNSEEDTRVYHSKSVLGTYPVGIMRLRTTKPVRSIELFGEGDTVYTNKSDYADNYLQEFFHGAPPFVVKNSGVIDAMDAVLSGQMKYYICGKDFLEGFVRYYHAENKVVVDDIDIPDGEFRFISNDPLLLELIDEQFDRLKSSNRYQPIVDRWFSGNSHYKEDNPLTDILIVVGAVIFIVIGIITFVIVVRISAFGSLKREFKSIANMAVEVTGCNVLAINVHRLWVYNVSGNLLPPEGLPFSAYEALIHPDDIAAEYKVRRLVDDGEKHPPVISFRMRKYRSAEDDWRRVQVHAYVKSDRKGRPAYVYIALNDETERLEEQALLDRSLKEFVHITDISELGMAYYDEDGNFVNCNRAMVQLFDKGGLHKAEEFLRSTTVNDIPLVLNGYVVGEQNVCAWFCAPIDLPELNLHVIAEVRIESVLDAKGRQRGFSISALDLTDSLEMRHRHILLQRRKQHLTQSIERYKQETTFFLKSNHMHCFHWAAGNNEIEISHDMLTCAGKFTIDEFFAALEPDDAKNVRQMVENPKEFFSRPFCTVLTINVQGKYDFFNPAGRGKCRFRYSITPDYDENGRFIGAFGILIAV